MQRARRAGRQPCLLATKLHPAMCGSAWRATRVRATRRHSCVMPSALPRAHMHKEVRRRLKLQPEARGTWGFTVWVQGANTCPPGNPASLPCPELTDRSREVRRCERRGSSCNTKGRVRARGANIGRPPAACRGRRQATSRASGRRYRVRPHAARRHSLAPLAPRAHTQVKEVQRRPKSALGGC